MGAIGLNGSGRDHDGIVARALAQVAGESGVVY